MRKLVIALTAVFFVVFVSSNSFGLYSEEMARNHKKMEEMREEQLKIFHKANIEAVQAKVYSSTSTASSQVVPATRDDAIPIIQGKANKSKGSSQNNSALSFKTKYGIYKVFISCGIIICLGWLAISWARKYINE